MTQATQAYPILAARHGRAPLEACGAGPRARAIVHLFDAGFDTWEIAGLLHLEEAEVANVLARRWMMPGTAAAPDARPSS